MPRRFTFHYLSLTACTLALASAPAPAAPDQPVLTNNDVHRRADDLIVRMTPQEKAGQLQLFFALPNMAQQIEGRVVAGAGGLLFVTDPNEINRLQRLAIEKSRLGIPLLFGFDVIHGLSTVFPVPIAMTASWDPDLVMRSQAIAAAEARSVGITWTFAPMIDISRDPRWGRIVEGAGEDPYLASAMAGAQVRGFQGPNLGTKDHIISGPKHFAGYGAAVGGRDYDEAELSDAQLRNVYLPPFRAAVEAGAANIMTAYMPLNGVPVTGNHWLLQDLLRKEWGFTGWTVSDNNAVSSLTTHGFASDPKDAAARALNAGVDMEMTFGRPAFVQLPAALEDGTVTSQRLDQAVRRILEAKIRLGLFEKPYVDASKVAKSLRSSASLALAETAAERSAVLLKNEGDLLPLDLTRIRSIAVSGPLADSPRDTLGPWVFPQNEPATQSILAGLREKLGPKVQVSYSPGVAMAKRLVPSPLAIATGEITRPAPTDDATGIAEAVAAAKQADVAIVVVGEAQDMIGELASRSSLDLPGRQQDLLEAVVATGKPVVVLVVNGRPLDLKDTKAAAILDVWYPGSRGGAAAADLLFGDAVPGGKLPFTWPRNASQVPMYYSHLTTHDPRNANSRYWNESGAPVYPFGYGLSYSTFEYSGLSVAKAQIAPTEATSVTVEVRNTGARTADEVVQLYIHQRSGSSARPVRELKGFQRVTLQPGEARPVAFTLGPDELRYWSAATHDWVIDESVFDVAVGGSSVAPFGATFKIASGR